MNLLIRADASTQIGTGHVMRGLALALRKHLSSFQSKYYLSEAYTVKSNTKNTDRLRTLIQKMRLAYQRGENAMASAREIIGESENSLMATLISYDLQAGSPTFPLLKRIQRLRNVGVSKL